MVCCSRLVIFYFREKFCFARVGKSRHIWDVYFYSVPKTLSKKLYLQLSLTQIVHSNDKMFFHKPNNYLSKFLWRTGHVYLFFTSRKSYVLRHVSARCLFWRPCRKNYISSSTWHKSFIQMVKYSFPDERIVYWSFLNINLSVSVSYAVDFFFLTSMTFINSHTPMYNTMQKITILTVA